MRSRGREVCKISLLLKNLIFLVSLLLEVTFSESLFVYLCPHADSVSEDHC